ncbi:MAG TPA: tRNA uridine-5-carboxymethylaminomethyl(34) synthesis enzyme MnmG, partial [Candidatus Krumholzibacteria bacterium]|nr:tRNA uridine-5-carboxymethylaminomethyl(34) synthesis enzyme MnmG [Candidatus Krumholzibacteria bacterium]
MIVVGGGHAGIEAAHAGARLGLATVLVTHDAREVGRMPCNPAIGGLGKGHLVREIDALGGVMGRVIDRTGIQFRVLNRRKGPAVQAPRAQADKHRYQAAMADFVAGLPGLSVLEADAARLLTEPSGARRRVLGVGLADGRELLAPRVVLCSGTFLGGLMHVGEDRTPGGREGAAASSELSGSLREAGFELLRLKTGTPPRLHADSLDYDRLEVQPGDPDPRPFSHFTRDFAPDQVVCWTTVTGEAAHDLIRRNLDRSPLYAGAIQGTGPRYCPSIEDKVVRFPDRGSHTIFLEPEGLDTPEIYVNGISTSLPRDVQEAMVRTIPGLEHARFLRYGYAVEYDSIPSWQITPSLESGPVEGLWLAGQILGTSGYEEAAGQGLMAGLNAARTLQGLAPMILGRDEAYLGVLVDDLNTKEISEPYRMFTSRAEHRLSLRCDNAATRLLARAEEAGLLEAAELEELRARVGVVRGLISGLGRIPSRNPHTGDTETVAD